MNARILSFLLVALFACDRKDDAVVAKAEPTKAEPAKAEPVKPAEVKPPTPTVPDVAPTTAVVPSDPPTPPDAEDDFALMKAESFGDLKLGMSEADAKKMLPSAKKDAGKCEFSEASGDKVRFIQNKAAGVQLTVSCEKARDVQSIRVFAPSTLKSKRGIGIGDTTDAVKKAYGDSLDPQSEPDDNNIVAGSVYGGLGFTLKDGKVTEMFLGAMAE